MGLQRNGGIHSGCCVQDSCSLIHLTYFYLAYVPSTISHAGESVVNKIDELLPHGIYILIEIDRSQQMETSDNIENKRRLFIQSLLSSKVVSHSHHLCLAETQRQAEE